MEFFKQFLGSVVDNETHCSIYHLSMILIYMYIRVIQFPLILFRTCQKTLYFFWVCGLVGLVGVVWWVWFGGVCAGQGLWLVWCWFGDGWFFGGTGNNQQQVSATCISCERSVEPCTVSAAARVTRTHEMIVVARAVPSSG